MKFIHTLDLEQTNVIKQMLCSGDEEVVNLGIEILNNLDLRDTETFDNVKTIYVETPFLYITKSGSYYPFNSKYIKKYKKSKFINNKPKNKKL